MISDMIKRVEGQQFKVTQDEFAYLLMAAIGTLVIRERITKKDMSKTMRLVLSTLAMMNEQPIESTMDIIKGAKEALYESEAEMRKDKEELLKTIIKLKVLLEQD